MRKPRAEMADLIDHPVIQAVARRIQCECCGSRRGTGVVLARARREDDDLVRLIARCTTCGSYLVARVVVPAERTEPATVAAPVSVDDILDVRAALNDDGWWREAVGR